MAMHKPEKLTFDEIVKVVDKLPSEERGRLIRHLEFRSCDEAWDRLTKEINEKRKAQGLPPATDEDIHAEIDARRTPEQLDDLRYEIQKGIDSLNRYGGIPAEEVFAELKERYKKFKKAAP